jgi:hypothetical protein
MGLVRASQRTQRERRSHDAFIADGFDRVFRLDSTYLLWNIYLDGKAPAFRGGIWVVLATEASQADGLVFVCFQFLI